MIGRMEGSGVFVGPVTSVESSVGERSGLHRTAVGNGRSEGRWRRGGF